MQAKIYMYLGDLILSEDLAIRMQDLPETIDREAFLREPSRGTSSCLLSLAAALGLSEAFARLGALIETGDVIAQAEDFQGIPPRSPENQALQLYRQAIAGGSESALRDFIVLMMTSDATSVTDRRFFRNPRTQGKISCRLTLGTTSCDLSAGYREGL